MNFRQACAVGTHAAIRDFVRRGQAMTSRLEAFCKPVIAAVNGIAFGGGCEITEAVHLAIASDKACFAKPEIKLGMPPTFGGTQRLPRLAGRKRALELLLTGDPFTPAHARRSGWSIAVVPHDDLLPAARELAGRITRHSPLAIHGILAAVDPRAERQHRRGAADRKRAVRRPGADARSRRRPRGVDRASAAIAARETRSVSETGPASSQSDLAGLSERSPLSLHPG